MVLLKIQVVRDECVARRQMSCRPNLLQSSSPKGGHSYCFTLKKMALQLLETSGIFAIEKVKCRNVK